MKIKVGDWVKVENEGTIGKITLVEPNKYIEHYGNKMLKNVVFIDNQTIKRYERELTKLPIKFKGFEIVIDNSEPWEGSSSWGTYRKIKGIGSIHFVCIEEGTQYFTGFKVPHEKFVTKHFTTPDQARDWLELQYATMLAKARGLV